jgi:hypothetical protein
MQMPIFGENRLSTHAKLVLEFVCLRDVCFESGAAEQQHLSVETDAGIWPNYWRAHYPIYLSLSLVDFGFK